MNNKKQKQQIALKCRPKAFLRHYEDANSGDTLLGVS